MLSSKSVSWFTRFAKWIARMTGRPLTFALAINALLDLEELDDKDLDRIRDRYEKLAQDARETLDDIFPVGGGVKGAGTST